MQGPESADPPMPSSYYDQAMIAVGAARGEHRAMVGGLWDELGELQLDFLKARGLAPGHSLLDIGCGCLRGGVRFAAYLEPGRYCGLDVNQSLLDAGRAELEAAGLSGRVPPENLRQGADFDLAAFGHSFDMALAVSLFTHLPAAHLRICLERLAPVLRPGGSFYASFFLLPEGHGFAEPCAQTPEITSYPDRDPYHHRLEDLRAACLGLPFSARLIGDWGHPRNQRLVVFERDPEGMAPGADHYRAYVGPPERYDFLGASQFSLLFHLGLRENHRVLDFGCGSLRLGRLLIPWLAPGRYFGIDPSRWLIDEAFAHELGPGLLGLKQPSFDHNADFDCAVFGQRFDFVVAQSILTHCGPDLCRRFFGQLARVLAPDGLAVFSYIPGPGAPAPAEGWHYPQCVAHAEADLLALAREAGLCGVPLPWSHPGATWFAVAKGAAALPDAEARQHLRGTVLSLDHGARRADPPAPARRPNPRVPLADQEEAAELSAYLGLGRARLVEPAQGPLQAGGRVRLELEYVAGPVSVAPGGRILFCFHHVCSWSPAQTGDPGAPGLVLATASNGAALTVRAWADAHWADADGGSADTFAELFPWQHAVEVRVGAPGLYPGDAVRLTYGAGPALAVVQCFEARPYRFRVLVDPQGLGFLLPAEEEPWVDIVGGPAARLVLLCPSDQPEGKGRALVRLEDEYGNLASGFAGQVVLDGPPDVLAAPQVHSFGPDESPSHCFEGLDLRPTGLCRLTVCAANGLTAQGNPFRVRPQGADYTPLLWGEIHGHSALSDGHGRPEEYFAYARSQAGLDLAALTDHDFMLSDKDWARGKAACNAANAPGAFVTLHAFEWSGPLEGGGDRNVYFRGDDPPLCRARPLYHHLNMHLYHGPEPAVNHAEDLFRWLDRAAGPGEAVVVPHWGGRPADPRFTDPRHEKLVEIFSEHRNSEDWAGEFLRAGARLGFTAGGDDHMGRPGNGFLAYGPLAQAPRSGGGLVAVLARREREDVFQALAAGRTYATTGARIVVDCGIAGLLPGGVGPCGGPVVVRACVLGTAHLERVEILRDGQVVYSQLPGADPSALRLEWSDPDFAALGRECAYWLRVVQVDGHLAATSPVRLTPAGS